MGVNEQHTAASRANMGAGLHYNLVQYRDWLTSRSALGVKCITDLWCITDLTYALTYTLTMPCLRVFSLLAL